MDLDVLAGAPETLKKNVYKILHDGNFARSLAVYGIEQLKLNDPVKAKQTDTTQRFRLRLVTRSGEELPTKVEFSRRPTHDAWVDEDIDPAVAGPYRQLAFRCQHYVAASAVLQKVRALAGRPATQARDVFDLNILYLSDQGGDANLSTLEVDTRTGAAHRAMSISYAQYCDQVVAYLDPGAQHMYGGRPQWEAMQARVVNRLS